MQKIVEQNTGRSISDKYAAKLMRKIRLHVKRGKNLFLGTNMTIITETNKEILKKTENETAPVSVSNSKYPKKLARTYSDEARAMIPLTKAVTDEYQGLAVRFSQDLIVEYDCKTPTEISLARIAAIAYVKSFDYSEELRNCRDLEWLSDAKNGYFSMIGKEVDRANRQFMSAIMALRQIKTPSIEVNVTAKTAFIAQNQQLNVNQNNNENIEPK